ncbi:alpha/beta-hydrolase [Schizopora paradoxa]|uniref:Alpha/beta-hydrolase n=1 Tax=Schizopora paradoxa TaxID=27342 RepID=A0A0H2R6V7_9AGAM|nr:alpha/beta-hydrolase [Schizopora paradoxa]
MDPSLYKDFKTSRGYAYHYLYSPAKDGKPTLLFMHGFPSTSYSWNKQVAFFANLGYGVIAPDLLGYGETDKPTDRSQYRMKLMVQDLLEILDDEKVARVIAVAHDWGAVLSSRLANYYQHDERLVGFAFFAISYFLPVPDWSTTGFIKDTAQFHDEDTEVHGYFAFFVEEDAARTIEEHAESFFSLLYAGDEKIFQKNFCPIGKLKEWLLSDKMTTTAPWFTAEEKKLHTEPVIAGGFTTPLCWYKQMNDTIFEEAAILGIPKENYYIQKPVFFAAGLKDVVLPPKMSNSSFEYCPNMTTVEVDPDHFLINSAPDECNKALLAWVETLTA